MPNPADTIELRVERREELERGVTRALRCPAYRAGHLVAPASATLTLSRPDGTKLLDAVPATVAEQGASYDVAIPGSETLSDGWTLEWALTFTGITGALTTRCAAAVVRRRLVCPISDEDLIELYGGLDPKAIQKMTGVPNHATKIRAGWRKVLEDIRSWGVLPEHVASLPDLRQVTLDCVLEMVFADLATRTDGIPYLTAAEKHGRAYQAGLKTLRVALDRNEDGTADNGGRRRGPVVLIGSAAPGRGYDWATMRSMYGNTGE